MKRVSAEPRLPGAWSATPDEENMEEATTIGKTVDVIVRDNDPGAEGEPRHTLDVAQETSPERSLHDVDARITSPELVLNAGEGTRKRSRARRDDDAAVPCEARGWRSRMGTCQC